MTVMTGTEFLLPAIKGGAGKFLLLIAAIILIKFLWPRIKGWLGEKSVNLVLRKLPPDEYRILNDIMIPNQGNSTQIDHVVVSRYGVFVIETKTMKGFIYGSEKDKMWTQVINPRSKFQFMNPLRQNYAHVKALEELLGGNHVYPIVAFADGKFKKQMPPNVIYVHQLPKYISQFSDPVLTRAQVAHITAFLGEANITDKKSRRDHIRSVRTRKNR